MAKKRKQTESVTAPRIIPIESKPGFWKTDGTALLALTAATVIFYFPVLSLQGPIWNDFIEQYFPYRVFASRALRHLTFPFWNPYSFSGMPFFADIQSAVLYPFNLLLVLFSGRNGISPVVYEYQIIGHILLAGIFTYVLAGDFNRSRTASLLAALIYMLGGFTTTHIFHITMIHALPWFACSLLTLRRALQRSSVKYAILTGAALCCVAFAGHPQMFVYLHYLLGACFVWHLIEHFRTKQPTKKVWIPVAIFLLAIGSGAGLSAVQLLPASKLGEESQRPKMEYRLSAQGSFRPYRFITLVAPNFFSTPNNCREHVPYYWGTTPKDIDPGAHYFWETSLYLGVLPLFFTLLALLMLRSPPVFFLGTFAAGSFLIAMGDATPVYRLAYMLVPGMKLFRNPARIGIIFTLMTALLSAFSTDWLIGNSAGLPSVKKKKIALISAGIGAIILIFSIAFSSGVFQSAVLDFIATGNMFGNNSRQLDAFVSQAAYPYAAKQLWLFAVLALGTLGILLGRMYGKLPVRTFSLLVPAVLLIDVLFFGYGFAIMKTDPTKIYESNPLIRSIRDEYHKRLFRINSRGSLPGTDNIGGPHLLFRRNEGTVHELFLMEGYNPLRLKRELMDRKQRTFDVLNIGYKISVDEASGRIGIVPHPTGFPRVRMVSSFTVETDESRILPLLQNPDFDYATTVILEETPEGIPSGNHGPINASATITSYGYNKIVTEVSSDRPALLVLSEVFYPAWKATVDGRSAKVLRADYALRAIPVPAGKHRVICRYSDSAFNKGLLISLLTLAGIAAALVAAFLRKKKE
ncbi:MAG: YfhO family protein [Chitinispirillaceae bacterium]|nr:YfhO family protein [Chitinispirillaceae bacterium]